MASNVNTMVPKWSLRVPKWSLKVSKITLLGIKSDPFQQSTSQQFPAAKGAGGRGEALKYSVVKLILMRERTF